MRVGGRHARRRICAARPPRLRGSRAATAALLGIAAAAVFLLAGCATILFRPTYPKVDGTVSGLPVSGPVRIIRDGTGIPHIRAQSRDDMYFAQGWVHAQDRLFFMEMFRRLSQGTLSQLVGDAALDLDYFVRLIGIPELRRRAADNLDAQDRAAVEAYVRGINAYLAAPGTRLPAELGLLGDRPEPWVLEDAFGNLALVAWLLQDNYVQELFYLQTKDRITPQEYDLLFAGTRDTPPLREDYVRDLAPMRIAPLQREATAFLTEFLSVSGGHGSNLWAVAGRDGGPALLANDTHLSVLTPSLWYINHLSSPGMDVAGFTIPGSPGVYIGHNGRIAWGLTTLHADTQDLVVLTTDPERPTRYLVGDTWHDMSTTEIAIPRKRGPPERRVAYGTIYGPVLTKVEAGAGAAVALRWFGSLADGELRDRSTRGFFRLATAGSVDDAIRAAGDFAYVEQNLVVADAAGSVAKVVLGALPVRSGYSGRYPALGSRGAGWVGFVHFEDKPRVRDPPGRLVISANDPVRIPGQTWPVSQIWPAPYRSERLHRLLGQGADPGLDDFARIQMDLRSGLADQLLPTLLTYHPTRPEARRALEILEAWDRVMDVDSPGALVFEVFVRSWMRNLLSDELGEDLDAYLLASADSWSAKDVMLSHPDSDLWDDRRTPGVEGPADIVERSLADAMDWITKRLGPEERAWRWGAVHTITFRHPAGSGPLARLVNRGPYPLGGSISTVDVAASPDSFDVQGIPTLRFLVDLADPDSGRVVAPPGQSGVPTHPHYDDQIQSWLTGRSFPLPFTPAAVDRAGVSTQTLSP